jgi:hypothetical protein
VVDDELLAARKVLLTDTALKVGFLATEEVLAWLLSSSFAFEESVRAGSVSDPPLTLVSVKLSCSSTLVMCLFSMSSVTRPPFTAAEVGSSSWLSDSKLVVCIA